VIRFGQAPDQPCTMVHVSKVQVVAVNGAEWLELDARAAEANLTVPAYVRTLCGFQPWIERGREMAERGRFIGRRPRLALERRSVTIPLTDLERERLLAEAQVGGSRLAQYIRSKCGFQSRNTSLPGTDERGAEEDDAWERLKRLGLKPEEYFPSE
jgi:hypothetical protein